MFKVSGDPASSFLGGRFSSRPGKLAVGTGRQASGHCPLEGIEFTLVLPLWTPVYLQLLTIGLAHSWHRRGLAVEPHVPSDLATQAERVGQEAKARVGQHLGKAVPARLQLPPGTGGDGSWLEHSPAAW